jgi:hypothetical protein
VSKAPASLKARYRLLHAASSQLFDCFWKAAIDEQLAMRPSVETVLRADSHVRAYMRGSARVPLARAKDAIEKAIMACESFTTEKNNAS